MLVDTLLARIWNVRVAENLELSLFTSVWCRDTRMNVINKSTCRRIVYRYHGKTVSGSYVRRSVPSVEAAIVP